jgi:integrase
MLTDTKIKAAVTKEKQWKLSDGKGLFLLVHPNGGRYWRFSYRFGGKQKTQALGVYPDVSLKEARNRRDEIKLGLNKGLDPAAKRLEQKKQENQEKHSTVVATAERWVKKKAVTLSESQNKQINRILKRDIYPAIGDKQVADIKRVDLVDVVRMVEEHGTVLAKNAGGILNGIFQLAQDEGLIEINPAQRLRSVLSRQKVKHYAACTTPEAFAEIIRKIDAYDGRPPLGRAVKILARVFCSAQWTCALSKTKSEIIIPLSWQVIKMLEDLKKSGRNSDWVFAAGRGDGSRHIGAELLTTGLRNSGVAPTQQTCHGFRASARTILDEVLGYRMDWIEQELGHVVRDVNGRAYNRTTHLEGRREMMQAWADYLDAIRDGKNIFLSNQKNNKLNKSAILLQNR